MNIEEFIKKSASQVAMTSEEKSRIRARLKMEMAVSAVAIPEPSWFFFQRHFVGVSLAMVILLVGATSAFAEGSLPGDFLYRFKTGVNEQVLSWFAGSEYSKAQWSVRLAERRLTEAEHLALRPDVATNVQAFHDRALELQLKRADTSTQQYEEENTMTAKTALTVSTDVEAPLETSSLMIAAQSSTSESAPVLAKSQEPDVSLEMNQLKERILALRQKARSVEGERGRRERALRAEAELLRFQKQLFDNARMPSANNAELFEDIDRGLSSIENRLTKLTISSSDESEAQVKGAQKSSPSIENDSSGDVENEDKGIVPDRVEEGAGIDVQILNGLH